MADTSSMRLHSSFRVGAPDPDLADLIAAVHELFNHHADLFEVDANERSITHHLALCLADRFSDWHVDCEYNRDGFDPKMVDLDDRRDDDPDDVHGSRVYPDIIVHRRRKADNLLVVEVKKSTSPRSDVDDLKKLSALRCQLGYRYALSLRFGCRQVVPTVQRVVWA